MGYSQCALRLAVVGLCCGACGYSGSWGSNWKAGPCGSTDVSGVRIELPHASHATIKVGERRRVMVTLGPPHYRGSEPGPECKDPSAFNTYFPRVEWHHATHSPFDTQLVSCPCSVEYERDDGGYYTVVAQATAGGVLVLDLVGREAGVGFLSATGWMSGPCPSGIKPELRWTECGPNASDEVSIEVTAE